MSYENEAPTLSARSLPVFSEGVMLVAPNGVVSAVNDAMANLLAMPSEEVVGSDVFDPPWQLESANGLPLAAVAAPPARGLSNELVSEEVLLLRCGSNASWVRMRSGPADPQRPGAGAVVTVTDLSAAVEAERSAHRLTFTDVLTDLASRDHMTQRVADALQRCRGTKSRVGLLHVDLDGFRTVNDTFGPTVGDAVLVEVADRLRGLVEHGAEVGRVGVDEFLVMIRGDDPGLSFDVRLRDLAGEVQRRIAMPLVLNGMELHLSASIGAARGPDDATVAVELMAAADRALRTRRDRGRSQLHFHDATIDIRRNIHVQLDRDLRTATTRGDLEVFYQPMVDLRDGNLVGAEALIRWHHPQRGPISPSQFIPAAEATGAINAISEHVLHTVARDLLDWDRCAAFPTEGRVAVNISAVEFNRRDFVGRLSSMLASAQLDPQRIELEITESLLLDDLHMAAERLRRLDRLGVRVALDDFGTGYSSLSYLHQLPLHTLKIDRRFTREVLEDRPGTITRTIVALARNLGVVSVAEGVENDLQRRFLREAGCDLAQGFLIAPPLPRVAFDRFLAHRVPTAMAS